MKVHFISIGGSVMHQLAIALKQKGYEVTGSDDEIFEPSRTHLENAGLLPNEMGWNPDHIDTDTEAVILGMHAKSDNPEIKRARELGIKMYSFPEYIFSESKNKIRVVVGGSHGKTTTTSMIMHVLNLAQNKFDYMVGAKLEGFDQSVALTDAPVIVCEGDEYPASALLPQPKFHFLFPHIAILTGIAWDHINVFPTFENYLEQFRIFINKIESNGTLIYNETDDELNRLIEANRRDDLAYVPYGVPKHIIENGKTVVEINGASSELKIFGDHNLLNLHAAWYACKELGINEKVFLNSISSFSGASKRLEKLYENSHTIVYRDFAHAPSKVKATMHAVKQQFPDRKLVAVLELHTYSSLNRDFMKEYSGALNGADEAVVFYSKHALELKRMPPLEKEVVKQGFQNNNLTIITSKHELENWLNAIDYRNTNLLLMSSGNYEGLDLSSISQLVAAYD